MPQSQKVHGLPPSYEAPAALARVAGRLAAIERKKGLGLVCHFRFAWVVVQVPQPRGPLWAPVLCGRERSPTLCLQGTVTSICDRDYMRRDGPERGMLLSTRPWQITMWPRRHKPPAARSCQIPAVVSALPGCLETSRCKRHWGPIRVGKVSLKAHKLAAVFSLSLFRRACAGQVAVLARSLLLSFVPTCPRRNRHRMEGLHNS
jgi:hypothetical protein